MANLAQGEEGDDEDIGRGGEDEEEEEDGIK